MDAGTAITVGTGIASALGGYLSGKVFGNASTVETATNVVELLKTEVEVLQEHVREKDEEVVDLKSRVQVLESLITQRAEVEAVHLDVLEVKGTVGKIADKLGVER